MDALLTLIESLLDVVGRPYDGIDHAPGQWPVVALAQQGERVRRIGVITGTGVDADDADVKASCRRGD